MFWNMRKNRPAISSSPDDVIADATLLGDMALAHFEDAANHLFEAERQLREAAQQKHREAELAREIAHEAEEQAERHGSRARRIRALTD